MPAVPPTLQVMLERFALGATPRTPVTVAVKVRVELNVGVPTSATTTDGVTLAIVTVVGAVGAIAK